MSQVTASTPWKSLLRLCLAAALLAIAAGARNADWETVFSPLGICYLDPDAYVRMHRVRLLEQDPWHPIHRHAFDNAPEGCSSHYTAPLDYLLLASSLAFRPFYPDAIDRAGALLPPVLGLLFLLVFWGWSSRYFTGAGRLTGLAFLALSPPVARSFNLGFPDHQVLILLLAGYGLLRDYDFLAGARGRMAQFTGGLAWGMALWVTLYEPALLLSVSLLASFSRVGKQIFFERTGWWMGLALALVCCTVIERPLWIPPLDEDTRPVLSHFLSHVYELQQLGWLQACLWFGGWILMIPWVICHGYRENRVTLQREIWWSCCVSVFLLLATLWQIRWGPLLAVALGFFMIPLLFQHNSRSWKLAVSALLFFPIFSYHLRPPQADLYTRDQPELRQVARGIDAPGTVLSTWIHSPSLLYFSRQPIIASGVHTTVQGMLDGSLFFTEKQWLRAREILIERQVRWIVIPSATEALAVSFELLDGAAPPASELSEDPSYRGCMAARLDSMQAVPPELHLKSVVGRWKLYEFLPSVPQAP